LLGGIDDNEKGTPRRNNTTPESACLPLGEA
jgi:hypothetical protein